MSDADNIFVQATDNLIALYRSVERRTLDLPFLSIMPFLIFMWAFLRFYFFLLIGLFLIVPTNLVILIRNLFPGENWRYRPFFFSHLYYAWLWLWRGEAPTAPFIFVRPLLDVLAKMHFARRLQRLRTEITLRDELSDATKSALHGRIDAALERWKTFRFTAIFSTVLVPATIGFPTWWKETTEFLGGLGIRLPTDLFANFIAQNKSPFWRLFLGLLAFGYLLAIPITACLAKRGLFLGSDPRRICFPGAEAGSGIYLNEREILSGVGIHTREAPIDLWLVAAVWVLSLIWMISSWDRYVEMMQSIGHGNTEKSLLIQNSVTYVIFAVLISFAALRRRRTDRA
jgi:hypothetical protein